MAWNLLGKLGHTRNTCHYASGLRRLDFLKYLDLVNSSIQWSTVRTKSNMAGTALTFEILIRLLLRPFLDLRTSSMSRPGTRCPLHRSDMRYEALRKSMSTANCWTSHRRDSQHNPYDCDNSGQSQVPCICHLHKRQSCTGNWMSSCVRYLNLSSRQRLLCSMTQSFFCGIESLRLLLGQYRLL